MDNALSLSIAPCRSLEKVVEELQKDFEQAMETVVFQIRKNHGVTEQQMTAAMVHHQKDPVVQTALSTLREVWRLLAARCGYACFP